MDAVLGLGESSGASSVRWLGMIDDPADGRHPDAGYQTKKDHTFSKSVEGLNDWSLMKENKNQNQKKLGCSMKPYVQVLKS